ncbi:hypothetical protein [Bacillus toyonensis]|uniref:hypothetical protein n=1 Tax=Bacillus toyonensis TaxID=155322 RepID=UPI0021D238E1|nr:hypothetical protein [Bacillus toyonensis]MCU4771052.1 hypothetical protein [Bacillus toyonensis]
MKKIEIAKELLKNSLDIYRKEKIEGYISHFEAIEDEVYFNEKGIGKDFLIRFNNCITYIQEVEFDIKGWMLYEIPIYYCYCFYNKSTEQRFDLTVFDSGEVKPTYINQTEEKYAKTIEEAIKKYNYDQKLL